MLFPDAPALDRIADFHLEFAPPLEVGASPYGGRTVLILRGGAFDGPRLRGRIRPGGGGWALRRADGALELDVRATLECDDGALAYLSCSGLAATALAADAPFRAIARFETGHERIAGLNGVVCAGSGFAGAGVLALRVFALR